MTPMTLRADCARCAALCCVALAFDRSELFAFDKPAGEPCHHLTARGTCSIHAAREQHGYAGCTAFDCGGAGQYVTQEMFGGRSWRDDPSMLKPMTEAFMALRQAHEQLALLQLAATLPLPTTRRRALEAAWRGLLPASGWTADDVAAGRVAKAVSGARRFLETLRPYVRRV